MNSVRGVKADTQWSTDRLPSIRDLKLKPHAFAAYENLIESVVKNGSNCGGRFEEYAGENLPGDYEAKVLCAGCASWAACDKFKTVARPSWGVWAGEVRRVDGNEGE